MISAVGKRTLILSARGCSEQERNRAVEVQPQAKVGPNQRLTSPENENRINQGPKQQNRIRDIGHVGGVMSSLYRGGGMR